MDRQTLMSLRMRKSKTRMLTSTENKLYNLGDITFINIKLEVNITKSIYIINRCVCIYVKIAVYNTKCIHSKK